jgi:diaminopimelate decarboxylase
MRGQIDDVRKVLDEAIRNSSQQCMSKRLSAELALSIKTNPLPLVLTTAIDKKMMVEAISLSEVRAAIAAGFAPNDIILNGPAKWFDFSTNTSRDNSSNYSTIQLFAIIADSAAELESLAAAVKSGKTLNSSINHRSPIDLAIVGAQYIGVRLAAPGTKSRFGADIGDSEILERLAAAMRLLPVDQKILYHFHYAPSTLGIQAWAGAVKAVLLAANAIDRVAGRDCTVLDFGGGWATNTFSTLTATKTLSDIFKMASNMFPKLSQIIFEPGKSILQSAGTLLTRVLCVRESTINMRDSCSMTDKADKYSTGRVAILDTNIAELPDLHSHEHPLAWLAREPHNSTWVPLSTGNDGNDALYGRICMEHDILATSMVLPDNLQVGDWIAIGSVGAYDISMAYHFGTAPNAVLEIDNL